MKYYIHTLNDKPAYFDTDQIYYMAHYAKINTLTNLLCTSLKQIREDQEKHVIYRESINYESGKLSYMLVYTP